MTVAELIEKLGKFNPDEIVHIFDGLNHVSLCVHPEDQTELDRARIENPAEADEWVLSISGN